MIATRFTNFFGSEKTTSTQPAVLVRIYPAQGIGQPIQLESSCITIGRDEQSSLSLDDDSVSRRHATIECVDGKYLVTDQGSTNGTFVNEHRIQSVELKPGDRVRFGNQIFKFLGSDGIEKEFHELVFKMMTTDGLTLVHNKKYFLENLERELMQSARSSTPLSVLLMDLDKFKSINDTFGHLAGDAVLVEFARRAKAVLRSGELLARYGGEEFALLCSRSSLEEAAMAGERIRTAIAAQPVHFESSTIPMTVSIGVACFEGEGNITPSQLVATADHWLYQAKQSGRNQVQFQKCGTIPNNVVGSHGIQARLSVN